jgi:CheY-like chemotaxis protein
VVGNGKLALEAVEKRNITKRKNEFQIILMDLQMPELDGMQATKKIREAFRNCPHDERPLVEPVIIALTASSQPNISAKCIDIGFDAFLAKPFRIEDLGILLSKYASIRVK